MAQITDWKPCPDCQGFGFTPTKGKPQQDWPRCDTCEGKSEIPSDPEQFRQWKVEEPQLLLTR